VRDGLVRASLKRIALAHFYLSAGLSRWLLKLKDEPRFTLGGTCGGCAACCEAPAIRASLPVWYLRSFRRAFLFWQERVNGFQLVRTVPRDRLFVFRCSHFDPVRRRCDSYATRPGMCRDYPRGLLYQPAPELFAGCGYRAVARGRERWVQDLESRGLSPEQMRRLKKGLYLEP
jgi:Fe-S-cluster containining protein